MKRKREYGYGFSYANRPQNLPLAERVKRRKTRCKDLKSQIAFRKNDQRGKDAMGKYRKGYKLMMKNAQVRKRLLTLGFRDFGEYPKTNHHEGKMFSMPNDIPDKFDDEQAGWVCLEMYESGGLTKSQMEQVRATLSYAYQLQTGRWTTAKFKAQYESVRSQYSLQTDFAPPTQKVKAEYSAEPAGLKTAFTTEFVAGQGMYFPEWCVGGTISHDWKITGCRAGEKGGLNRVRKSRKHVWIPSQGVCGTYMLGGRPKTPGIYEERDWLVCRVCLCENGVHKGLPDNLLDCLDEDWNPVNPTWCTFCPLNMVEVVQRLLPEDEKGRTYCRWIHRQKRFAVPCLGHDGLIPLARRWMDMQGGNPDGLTFCSNSGRKSCGKWCQLLQIPYEESMPIHGDLWSTWSKYYQLNLKRDPGFKDRDQPPNLDEKVIALRKLAAYFGRGRVQDRRVDFSNTVIGQMMCGILRGQGQDALLAQILNPPEL